MLDLGPDPVTSERLLRSMLNVAQETQQGADSAPKDWDLQLQSAETWSFLLNTWIKQHGFHDAPASILPYVRSTLRSYTRSATEPHAPSSQPELNKVFRWLRVTCSSAHLHLPPPVPPSPPVRPAPGISDSSEAEAVGLVRAAPDLPSGYRMRAWSLIRRLRPNLSDDQLKSYCDRIEHDLGQADRVSPSLHSHDVTGGVRLNYEHIRMMVIAQHVPATGRRF